MKNGTLYAQRVKKLFRKLKREHGAPQVPEPTDPVDQMIVGLLAFDVSEQRAHRAARALRESVVDINELRVSTTAEIAEAMGSHIANNVGRAEAVRRALNAVFMKEHAVDLSHLHQLGRRDARHYLEQLDGVDGHAAASVVLWSLGGHAIPVDRRLYEAMKKEDLVDPEATIDEVQAFLERNINADDGKTFCLLMQKFSSAKAPRGGVARKKSAGAETKAKNKTPASSRRTAGR